MRSEIRIKDGRGILFMITLQFCSVFFPQNIMFCSCRWFLCVFPCVCSSGGVWSWVMEMKDNKKVRSKSEIHY